MSCRRITTVLRIPASALGFRYRREWDRFLEEHEDDFGWDPGYFGPSLSDEHPWTMREEDHPDRRLDERLPEWPEIVPGPFLDYCLAEKMEFEFGEDDRNVNSEALPLTKRQAEKYLPLYRKLFPWFTPEDMKAVRWCRYEWYDGTDAPYLYSDPD